MNESKSQGRIKRKSAKFKTHCTYWWHWYFICISALRNFHYLQVDYCPYLCCRYHSSSTVIPYVLHQVFVDPCNVEEFPNCNLYSIYIITLLFPPPIDISFRSFFLVLLRYYSSYLSLIPNTRRSTRELYHYITGFMKQTFNPLGYCPVVFYAV